MQVHMAVRRRRNVRIELPGPEVIPRSGEDPKGRAKFRAEYEAKLRASLEE